MYRYFGTKEGIILADEFDALTDRELASELDPNDPVATVRRAAA